MKKIRSIVTTKKVIITAIALMIVGGAGFAFIQMRSDNGEGDINYGPPTKEEKQQADNNKDKVAERIKLEQEAASAPPSNSKKTVTPIITRAAENDNLINVNAYVSGVFEEGGTCTAVFTQGNNRVTASSAGFGNVSTTGCTPMQIPRSEFSTAGDWSLVMEYNSDKAQGRSETKTVKVP